MKNKIKSLFVAALVLISPPVVPFVGIAAGIAIGCGTVYTIAVTLSDAEDAIMKEWATLHNDNRTTDDLDKNVMAAHAKFNEAKLVAANALRAYQTGGDKASYVKALEAARDSVGPLIDLLSPLLTPAKAQNMRVSVAGASKL